MPKPKAKTRAAKNAAALRAVMESGVKPVTPQWAIDLIGVVSGLTAEIQRLDGRITSWTEAMGNMSISVGADLSHMKSFATQRAQANESGYQNLMQQLSELRAFAAGIGQIQEHIDDVFESLQAQAVDAKALKTSVDALHIAVARSADETGLSTQELERMRELFQAFVDANRTILRERWAWFQKHAPPVRSPGAAGYEGGISSLEQLYRV